VRPIGHVKVCSVGGQAPTFALILEFPDEAEVLRVEYAAYTFAPCELVDLAVEQCYALGERFTREIEFLNHLPGLRIYAP
jgi:hypothetical protein